MTGAPHHIASRLWQKDVSLWNPAGDAEAESIRNGLGWLDLDWMQARAGELQSWARAVIESGDYDRVIHLGMGGSSAAAAAFASLFAPDDGLPLTVIDTTHPAEIVRLAGGLDDLTRVLFVVATKSGTTIETADLYHFFYEQLARQCDNPHARFVIITDEGAAVPPPAGATGPPLKILYNRPDIGGRYSALSYFGLAPAALLGVDIGKILHQAERCAEQTKIDADDPENALYMRKLAANPHPLVQDALVSRHSCKLREFLRWEEQLLAESLGKDGKGRVLVTHLIDDSDSDDDDADRDEDDLISPDRWATDDPYQLGFFFFLWQFIVAAAAAYMGVNPFDQPDVERSKARSRRMLDKRGRSCGKTGLGVSYDLHDDLRCRGLQSRTAVGSAERGFRYQLLYVDRDLKSKRRTQPTRELISRLRRHLTPGNYLAILAYLPETPDTVRVFEHWQAHMSHLGVPTTFGFGPRYLHSTGQFHKGGPPTGRFLQILAPPRKSGLKISARGYTFAELLQAQADADFVELAGDAIEKDGAIMRATISAPDYLQTLNVFTNEFLAVSYADHNAGQTTAQP